jgi:hypothetical protein
MTDATRMERYTDTLAPDAVSEELAPVIEELGLLENCRQLAEEGWTVVHNVAPPAFNERLRDRILAISHGAGANMLLAKDPVFAEAVLMPKLMALAEFSVGRGFLISQVAASVRGKGAGSIGLHADNNWLPAPFPDHNMLLTGCWACDGYTKEGGSTFVVPGSNRLRRHPDQEEVAACEGAVPIECEPGSVALWDGNLWHSNYVRTVDGDRVVCHITYTRLMMRPVEDYRAYADDLVERYGEHMAQLLGRHDMLMSPNGADYSKLVQTFNNAKR